MPSLAKRVCTSPRRRNKRSCSDVRHLRDSRCQGTHTQIAKQLCMSARRLQRRLRAGSPRPPGRPAGVQSAMHNRRPPMLRPLATPVAALLTLAACLLPGQRRRLPARRLRVHGHLPPRDTAPGADGQGQGQEAALGRAAADGPGAAAPARSPELRAADTGPGADRDREAPARTRGPALRPRAARSL